MGQDTITVTDLQRNTARRGILIQLGASGIALNHTSLSDALDDLDMWDFVENQVEVIASLHAWSEFYQRMLREKE